METCGYHYRYAPFRQLALDDAARWLTPREQGDLACLRDPRRREAWLAGRLVLKQLLVERLAHLHLEAIRLAEIEIVARNPAGQMVRPQACHAGRPLRWSLSIAHSDRAVLAAIAAPGMTVGVDLSSREQRLSRGFAEMWFSPEECRWLRGDRQSVLAAWAVKEAAYKALNRGERFEPRGLQIAPDDHGGWSCRPSKRPDAADCRITIWRTPCQELAVLATYQESSSVPFLEPHDD